jgi:hypothetical protein
MNEGQIVKCIKDQFPMVATTSDDKSEIGSIPDDRPTLGNYYQVREVLGDFISLTYFGEKDWWKADRFRLATTDELERLGLFKAPTPLSKAQDE